MHLICEKNNCFCSANKIKDVPKHVDVDVVFQPENSFIDLVDNNDFTGKRIDAANVTGTIDAANVTGTIDAANVTGTIDAANVTGTIVAANVTGTIDAANVTGTIAERKRSTNARFEPIINSDSPMFVQAFADAVSKLFINGAAPDIVSFTDSLNWPCYKHI
jgi:hypothetical protein